MSSQRNENCSELLKKIGLPEQCGSDDEKNIWGLLFGAIFSLDQVSRMLGKLRDPLPLTFANEISEKFVFDDLSDWSTLPSVIHWLSGYYLNSARLRTVFGFENTILKISRQEELSKARPAINDILEHLRDRANQQGARYAPLH